MSKITNDGLTWSGTGCFIYNHMATVGVKGLKTREDSRRDRSDALVSTVQAAVSGSATPSGPTRGCLVSGTGSRRRRTVVCRGRSSAGVPGEAGWESRAARTRRSDWSSPACFPPSGSSSVPRSANAFCNDMTGTRR